MLATFRAQAVMLQGIWFIQIAQILFKGVQPLPAHPLKYCQACFCAALLTPR